MAGGALLAGDNPHKIKGGRWTVFRFFLVSTAYTSVWLAVSSQLGSYRELFGPQVLLQLNIAYFLPSIPLLIVSGLFDKALEAKLGVARTVLVRLWLGLLGYGAICAWFPFQPVEIWYLLGSVVALGLFSGIAFSASYQLVARFANKNVIALGLGCSASGPLVLALQLIYDVGQEPSKRDEILMYETIAAIVVAGLWATTSLLVRHWDAIEGFEMKQQASLEEPLLGAEAGGPQPLSPPASPPPHPPSSLPLAPILRHRGSGMPPLIAYNSLEPYQTFVTAEEEYDSPLQHNSWSEGSLLGASLEEAGGWGSGAQVLSRRNSDPGSFSTLGSAGAAHGGPLGRPPLHPPAAGQGGAAARQPQPPQQGQQQEAAPEGRPQSAGQQGKHGEGKGSGEGADEEEGGVASPAGPSLTSAAGLGLQLPHRTVASLRGRISFSSVASNLETGSPHRIPPTTPKAPPRQEQGEDMRRLAWDALCAIWPALCALGLSCTISLVLFPFFTYVPTSGTLGESLPKTLFFARIFADVLGRFLPRLPPLAVSNPLAVLAVALAKLACVPLFFLYLKSPDRLHSDTLAVVFIAGVWIIGGYVNTMANLLAPRLVQPHLKPTAAGLMAITYQSAHLIGLIIATVAAVLLYGDIGVNG